jgi:peptidoglycan hydrolase CwlO-like protein
VLQQPGQPSVTLNNKQIVDILQALQNDVASRDQEIARLNHEYKVLHDNYMSLQKLQAAAVAAAVGATTTALSPASAPTNTATATATATAVEPKP